MIFSRVDPPYILENKICLKSVFLDQLFSVNYLSILCIVVLSVTVKVTRDLGWFLCAIAATSKDYAV